MRPRRVIAAALAVAGLMSVSVTNGSTDEGQSAAVRADYGDAPDELFSGYPLRRVVEGEFPALDDSNGARHTRAGQIRLGLRVNRERESKQVDRDRHDDGFYFGLARCRVSRLIFIVDARRLPASEKVAGKTAYLNAWFDWDRSGEWGGSSRCRGGNVPEWRVQNRRLDMATFARSPVQAISMNVLAGPQTAEMWVRASVTLNQPFTSPVGRGLFRHGETEDYFFRSRPGPPPGDRTPRRKTRTGDDVIYPVCAARQKSFGNALGAALLGVDLFMFHGESGEFDFLTWPIGAGPVKFTVDNAGALGNSFNLKLLPNAQQPRRLRLTSKHVDGPERIELYAVKIKASGSNLATKNIVCDVVIYHDDDGPRTTPQPQPPMTTPQPGPACPFGGQQTSSENVVGCARFSYDQFDTNEVFIDTFFSAGYSYGPNGAYAAQAGGVDQIRLTVPGGRQVTNWIPPPQLPNCSVGPPGQNSEITCQGGFLPYGEGTRWKVRTSPAPSPGMGGELRARPQGDSALRGPIPVQGP